MRTGSPTVEEVGSVLIDGTGTLPKLIQDAYCPRDPGFGLLPVAMQATPGRAASSDVAAG